MMSHLPEHVPDTEILEMFKYADKDRDGRISYDEFLVTQIIFYSFLDISSQAWVCDLKNLI